MARTEDAIIMALYHDKSRNNGMALAVPGLDLAGEAGFNIRLRPFSLVSTYPGFP
jgi:hypothetical protein